MIDSTFDLIVLIWMALAVLVFIVSILGFDFIGRFGGKPIGPRIPSSWGWFIMEIPALTILPFVYISQDNRHVVGDVLILAWVAHYTHRTLIWPWIVQRRSAPVPLITSFSGIGFNVVNGLLLGWFLTEIADYPEHWFSDPRFYVGALTFLFGAGLNIASDYRLAALRRASSEHYIIPHGGAFRFLSSPNLVGEMIEWIGFALMMWSLPGLAFVIWTLANLVPRALWRHRWYQRTFEDYPKDRRAIVPGLI